MLSAFFRQKVHGVILPGTVPGLAGENASIRGAGQGLKKQQKYRYIPIYLHSKKEVYDGRLGDNIRVTDKGPGEV